MKVKELIAELQKYDSELEVGLIDNEFTYPYTIMECDDIKVVENIPESSCSDESFFLIFKCKNGNILTEDYKDIKLKKAKELKLIRE